MSDTWRSTPPNELITAQRLDPVTGLWQRCTYQELRKGDIFKSFAPDSTQCVPGSSFEEVESEDIVGVALTDAIKLDESIADKTQGYGLECECGPMNELLKRIAQ